MSRGEFDGYDIKSTDAAIGALAVTPGASPLTFPVRQVTIGSSGVLEFISSVDGQTYITASLPAGSYPIMASHILAGTTATNITGWK